MDISFILICYNLFVFHIYAEILVKLRMCHFQFCAMKNNANDFCYLNIVCRLIEGHKNDMFKEKEHFL